jgi:hypothetical protein
MASCRAEVQQLFSKLNRAMTEQEQSLLWPDEDSNACIETTLANNQWSIVFGGKWSSNPISISEKLVEALCRQQADPDIATNKKVVTVSRTAMNDQISSSKVVHFAKQNLDKVNGDQEFEEIMDFVIEAYLKEYNNSDDRNNKKAPIVFYFTLGQHKGHNPFQRNLVGAQNFAKALQKIYKTKLISNKIPWKVVVTGTDATLPSTTVDPVIQVNGVTTIIPTYKIMPYNFVYAASKLGQFYTIAAAVEEVTGTSTVQRPSYSSNNNQLDYGSLKRIATRLENFVHFAGDNGNYRENDILSDTLLDEIARHWIDVVEKELNDHLSVAKGISICYTPLHRDPWTEAAFSNCDKESNGSPKAYMIQQIVKRFKNATSIDKAVLAHLCT